MGSPPIGVAVPGLDPEPAPVKAGGIHPTLPATVMRILVMGSGRLLHHQPGRQQESKDFNPEEARRATEGHGESIDALRAVAEQAVARSSQNRYASVAADRTPREAPFCLVSVALRGSSRFPPG
jgi:hypothetical protein